MKILIFGIYMTAFTILCFAVILPLALLHPNMTWYEVDLWFVNQGTLKRNLTALALLLVLYTLIASLIRKKI